MCVCPRRCPNNAWSILTRVLIVNNGTVVDERGSHQSGTGQSLDCFANELSFLHCFTTETWQASLDSPQSGYSGLTDRWLLYGSHAVALLWKRSPSLSIQRCMCSAVGGQHGRVCIGVIWLLSKRWLWYWYKVGIGWGVEAHTHTHT